MPRYEARRRSSGDRLGQDDPEVRAALRFVAWATVAGVGFLVLAAPWVRACGATIVATGLCGQPQRTMLTFGAPLILLATALSAFLRTYRVWRAGGVWWAWHGAGWFLLTLMVLTLSMGVPPIAVVASEV